MIDSTEMITNIRSDSNDSSSPYAVSTADILRFINYANQRLWSLILQTNPGSFQKETTISTVVNQRAYTPDANVYMKERFVKVEYKETTNDNDYYRLKEMKQSEYMARPVSIPVGYIRRSGQILPNPPISVDTGTFRLTYEAAPNTIKQKVGVIASVTDTGSAVTAIALDTSSDDETTLAAADFDFICITDIFGNSTMLNIPVTAYTSGTGAFTMSSHTYEDGEAIAVGSYVTLGKYTSSTSNLPDLCERYIQAYATWKCLARTTASPEKISHFKDEVELSEEDIIKSYQEPDKDDDDIVISQPELMLRDG